MPTVTCQYCGSEFEAPQSRIDIGRAKFCSRQCANAARVKKPQTGTCAWCGVAFTASHPNQRFCSQSCGAKNQALSAQRICRYCGEKFKATSPKQRFCGPLCRSRSLSADRKKFLATQQQKENCYGMSFDPWAVKATHGGVSTSECPFW
jgi:hypothetical protein